MILQRLALRAALACLVLASAPARADDTGLVSFYGAESGRLRADGYRFDPMEIGAAHWTLPLCRKRAREAGRCRPKRVRVTDLATGRQIVVPVTDRGPHPRLHRALDLSYGAALRLGILRRGVIRARIVIVD